MAEGKKSFIAYSDWKATFDEMSNEDAGLLIKHIFSYVNDENPVSDNVLIRVAFAQFKQTLKRDLNKWEEQLDQRREAGRRSAEKRAFEKRNERSTSVESRQRNSTDSVSVIDSVNDIIIDNVKEKRINKFIAPTPDDVILYCQERKNNVDAQKFFDFYESKGWMVGKNKMKDWKAAVRTWEKNEIKPNKTHAANTVFNGTDLQEQINRFNK